MNLRFWRKEKDPADFMKLQLEVAIKAGRRCAHDLAHAVDFITDKEWRGIFSEQSRHWVDVFYPDGGMKNYTINIQQRVRLTEIRFEMAIDRLKEHGIETADLEF